MWARDAYNSSQDVGDMSLARLCEPDPTVGVRLQGRSCDPASDSPSLVADMRSGALDTRRYSQDAPNADLVESYCVEDLMRVVGPLPLEDGVHLLVRVFRGVDLRWSEDERREDQRQWMSGETHGQASERDNRGLTL